MRAYIDLNILSNWVSMLRADIDGAILLIDDEREGEFYGRCVHSSSRVVPSPNIARQLLDIVHKRGVAGVAAAISGDYQETNLSENVFQPSVGDTASLLLTSQCCDRILEVIAGGSWCRALEKEIGSLRDQAIFLTWILEQSRRIGEANLPPLSSIAIENLIDWSDFSISLPGVNWHFGAGSIDEIQKLGEEAKELSLVSLLRGCDGMDVVRMITAAINLYRPRGLQSSSFVNEQDLLRMLRVAFDLSDLEKDQMYWLMRRWERLNPRFPLLSSWRILDPLQVVWDQRYWESDLRILLEMHSEVDGLTSLKMDLDNFKIVNEELGHTAGDEAIRLYCTIVKKLLSEYGEVYRRGGDEVVAFAPGLSGSKVEELGEKLRREIEREFQFWVANRDSRSVLQQVLVLLR